jgi:ubiquinone/menaquinone biosynthesis C-methylase UbiE
MTTTDKGYKGIGMEGVIASWYAKTTYSDLKRHQGLAQQLARQLPPGSRVLEIAPGPGYFCIELAKLGSYEITGLDISKSFVKIASENAVKAGVAVDFRWGNASNMPFADNSYYFIVCQAAFKNFSQPVEAIREMYRVLRPGGTAMILDMRRDASDEDLEREVNQMGVNAFNRAFILWTFRGMLLKRAYTQPEMEAFAAQTPFHSCQVQKDGIGFRAILQKPG